jgi:hypothetical protein
MGLESSFAEVFRLISSYIPFLPLAIGLYLIAKGKRNFYLYWIIAISLLSLTSDQISLFLARRFGNNMPWFHAYLILEIGAVLILFKKITKYHKLTVSIGSILLVFMVINTLLFENLMTFQTTNRVVSSFVILLFCISYFYQLFQTKIDMFIETSLSFWIVVSLLIYYSGAFFTFLLFEKMQGDGIWIFHNMANIAKYFILGLSLIFVRND